MLLSLLKNLKKKITGIVGICCPLPWGERKRVRAPAGYPEGADYNIKTN